ncbi:MAG: HAMP domain-containing histidine kinase [Deltaproteobacteria bacterium]
MKHLKLLICLFFLLLTFPVGYFVFQTYSGLAKEETARLRFFGETIFDEIEDELLRVVHNEETRFVDEYNHVYLPLGVEQNNQGPIPSPLSKKPHQDYILGYFQNNPDGSFHTPLTAKGQPVPDDLIRVVEELQAINVAFNRRRAETKETPTRLAKKKVEKKTAPAPTAFEEAYLDRSQKKSIALPSRQQENRVEEITVGQAQRLSSQSAAGRLADEVEPLAESDGAGKDRVEIAPFQSVFISKDRVFMFRRVVIGRKIFRQGFVIKLTSLADHLAKTHFREHPIARYANLRLDAASQKGMFVIADAGVDVLDPAFTLQRTFPFPFDFLSVEMNCSTIPRLASRRTLAIMMLLVVAIFVLGFLAIYQSARTVIDLSERRSRFVASVSHELKTPLTNIRMYIELLEQGIAKDPEHEQEYFSVLNTESVRLSRLINNVLELSRLENRQRRINLQKGDLRDVFHELETVMGEKIRQAGFSLIVDNQCDRAFEYDPEIMMLILINLVENSLKFGRQEPQKAISIKSWQDETSTLLAVADTGPGIPPKALKKIFKDFYRVEDALTQTTRGTGIGLALVRKFARLMKGTVRARNNDGPGCTITISIPG